MPQTIDRSADFLVTSATQTAETMKKLLSNGGFDVETTTETFGAPVTEEAPPEPVAEETPAAEEPVAEVVVEETPAEPVTEKTEEPVAVTPPVEEAPPPPAAEAVETPEQTEQRKPRNSRERKIVKLEAQLNEVNTEREKERQAREKLEKDLADLKARLDKPAEPPKKEEAAPAEPAKEPEPPKAAEPDPDLTEAQKPKLADFYEADDPNEAYLDALSEWRDNEKARKTRLADKAETQRKAEESRKEEDRKRSEAEKAQQQQIAKVNEEYADALKATRERHADFDAVLAKHGDRKLLSEPMRYAIWTNANPEILYWLGQNPDEAERITAETTLPEKATQRDIDRVMRKVHRELDAIESKIQASLAAPKVDAVEETDDEDLEDDEPEVTEEAPKSATPATPPPVAEKKVDPTPPPVETKPAPPEPKAETPKPSAKAASPAKKPTPVTPVGSRGGTNQIPLAEVARSSDPKVLNEFRKAPLDDYRKQRGM